VAKVTFSDKNIPVYEGKGLASSKKEAKKEAMEVIVRKIIKDGYIGYGFRDPNFL